MKIVTRSRWSSQISRDRAAGTPQLPASRLPSSRRDARLLLVYRYENRHGTAGNKTRSQTTQQTTADLRRLLSPADLKIMPSIIQMTAKAAKTCPAAQPLAAIAPRCRYQLIMVMASKSIPLASVAGRRPAKLSVSEELPTPQPRYAPAALEHVARRPSRHRCTHEQ